MENLTNCQHLYDQISVLKKKCAEYEISESKLKAENNFLKSELAKAKRAPVERDPVLFRPVEPAPQAALAR